MRLAILLLVAAAAYAADDRALVDRVGPTGFIQLEAQSFHQLTPRQQTLAYWLTQASIAVDPINYDQNSRFGLRQKRLLEEIMRHSASLTPDLRRKISDYSKLFWANRGNHNEMTAQKLLPAFTPEEVKTAAHLAWKAGGFRTAAYDDAPLTESGLDRELDALRPSIFDPAFDPLITAKSPQGKLDILQASANNFYSSVGMADLRDFHD